MELSPYINICILSYESIIAFFERFEVTAILSVSIVTLFNISSFSSGIHFIPYSASSEIVNEFSSEPISSAPKPPVNIFPDPLFT